MIKLRRHIVKVTLASLVACVTIVAILASAAYWRLSQGPVSLSFLSERIRVTLSRSLGGLPVDLEDIVIERDSTSGRINVRIRNLQLFDLNGFLIARAPRAAIELGGKELLTGSIVPVGLRLIGPNIKVRRLINGEIRLGFGDLQQELRKTARQAGVKDSTLRSTVPNSEGRPPGGSQESGTDSTGLIDYIKANFLHESGEGAAATIRSISISQAVIALYDEEKDTIWLAPEVNLAFKKVAFGVSLFVDGLINSAGEPWRVDVVANFRRNTGEYSLTARFHDLIPANISHKIFMISKLARVRLPLSGRIDLEFGGDGRLKMADGEISAAAGRVNFPDLLSRPLNVDEGLVRLKWQPQTKTVLLSDSSIIVGGMFVAVDGMLSPHWEENDRLDAVRFNIKTRARPPDSKNLSIGRGTIDRIDANGIVSLGQGRVDLDDLLIMSKKSGVRIRGVFAEGGENISVTMSGRVQNVPVEMLRTLWSPIIAPMARGWVNENISRGQLTDGSFLVDLPGHILGPALREKKPLPDGSVKVDVNFAGVTSNYYQGQPPFENLSGRILINGDRMALASLKGHIKAQNGTRVQINSGRMDITELANPVSKGDFKVQIAGPLRTFFDLADRKPLRFVSQSGFDPKGAEADTRIDLRVRLPLIENRPRGSTKVTANAELSNLFLPNGAHGLSLTAGKMKLTINNNDVKGSGSIKLADVPADLEWSRLIGPANSQSVTLKTTLTAQQRLKFGIDLSNFIDGPIKVKLEGTGRKKTIDKVRISADLSKAQVHLGAIHWRRPVSPETWATFDADLSDPETTKITNLRLSGNGLNINGDLTLDANGELVSAKLPVVQLGASNSFGLKVDKGPSGNLVLDVDGQTLDARSIIASLFDEATGNTAAVGDKRINVSGKFDSIYAFRNQHLANVRFIASTSGQNLNSMRLSGIFADRASLDLVVDTNEDGSRTMQLQSSNAGSALRASNLYSKVQGGYLLFKAHLGRPGEGTIRRGSLTLDRFIVANEKQLRQFMRDPKSNRKNEPLKFDRLKLPFAVDREFVRIGEAKIKGPAVGALAKGSIRKADGKLSIGGTLIPAYGLNSALSNLPLFGPLITGGKDEGIIGVTFGLRGTMKKPKLKINPVSALAPGILRKIFEFKGRGALDQKAPRKARSKLNDR